MQYRRFISVFSIVIATQTVAGTIAGTLPAQAENSAISVRRAAERTSFSDEEIKDGLFKTAFRAELQFGRHEERIRKFDGPVRVFVDNRGSRARTADVAAIVKDIRARVNHLDLIVTSDSRVANVVVILVPARDFARTIRSRYGENAAKKFKSRSIPNVCRESPRIRAIAFGAPRSSCQSMPKNLSFTIVPTKNCYNRWD